MIEVNSLSKNFKEFCWALVFIAAAISFARYMLSREYVIFRV